MSADKETIEMTAEPSYIPAGQGPHTLVIGSVAVSRQLGSDETGGEFSLVELRGIPGSGPGAHVDPWSETFYVLEGDLEFRIEHQNQVDVVMAGPGDVVSIPRGVPHAFSVTGAEAARYLILSMPAGIDAFFADAGEPIRGVALPREAEPFDRERLHAAFAKHGLSPHAFSAQPLDAAPDSGT